MNRRFLPFLFCVLTCAVSALAQGDAPLLTDNTETPGSNHWEINLGLKSERKATERVFEAPSLDLIYGIGERAQLKYEIPYLVQGSNEFADTRTGLGNSLMGVKYRFFENKEHEFAISTYPQLEVNNAPTNSRERGLVARGPNFRLPIEISKKVGPIDVNGEVGYNFRKEGNDYWVSGLSLAHQATKNLQLLGEVHSAGDPDESRDTVFDFGSRYRLSKQVLLMVMAGRSFSSAASGQPQFIGYLGLRIQLPGGEEKAEK